jgi:hypothetical protein
MVLIVGGRGQHQGSLAGARVPCVRMQVTLRQCTGIPASRHGNPASAAGRLRRTPGRMVWVMGSLRRTAGTLRRAIGRPPSDDGEPASADRDRSSADRLHNKCCRRFRSRTASRSEKWTGKGDAQVVTSARRTFIAPGETVPPFGRDGRRFRRPVRARIRPSRVIPAGVRSATCPATATASPAG